MSLMKLIIEVDSYNDTETIAAISYSSGTQFNIDILSTGNNKRSLILRIPIRDNLFTEYENLT